jgi:hypothetical protein
MAVLQMAGKEALKASELQGVAGSRLLPHRMCHECAALLEKACEGRLRAAFDDAGEISPMHFARSGASGVVTRDRQIEGNLSAARRHIVATVNGNDDARRRRSRDASHFTKIVIFFE